MYTSNAGDATQQANSFMLGMEQAEQKKIQEQKDFLRQRLMEQKAQQDAAKAQSQVAQHNPYAPEVLQSLNTVMSEAENVANKEFKNHWGDGNSLPAFLEKREAGNVKADLGSFYRSVPLNEVEVAGASFSPVISGIGLPDKESPVDRMVDKIGNWWENLELTKPAATPEQYAQMPGYVGKPTVETGVTEPATEPTTGTVTGTVVGAGATPKTPSAEDIAFVESSNGVYGFNAEGKIIKLKETDDGVIPASSEVIKTEVSKVKPDAKTETNTGFAEFLPTADTGVGQVVETEETGVTDTPAIDTTDTTDTPTIQTMNYKSNPIEFNATSRSIEKNPSMWQQLTGAVMNNPEIKRGLILGGIQAGLGAVAGLSGREIGFLGLQGAANGYFHQPNREASMKLAEKYLEYVPADKSGEWSQAMASGNIPDMYAIISQGMQTEKQKAAEVAAKKAEREDLDFSMRVQKFTADRDAATAKKAEEQRIKAGETAKTKALISNVNELTSEQGAQSLEMITGKNAALLNSALMSSLGLEPTGVEGQLLRFASAFSGKDVKGLMDLDEDSFFNLLVAENSPIDWKTAADKQGVSVDELQRNTVNSYSMLQRVRNSAIEEMKKDAKGVQTDQDDRIREKAMGLNLSNSPTVIQRNLKELNLMLNYRAGNITSEQLNKELESLYKAPLIGALSS